MRGRDRWDRRLGDSYRLTAYALDRYGVSLDQNRSLRALGCQYLGDNRTIFGREKVGLRVRPTLRGVDYSRSAWAPSEWLSVSMPERERIHVRESVAPRRALAPASTRAPARAAARTPATRPPGTTATSASRPRSSAAVTSDGACRRPRVPGHALCQKHLVASARGKSVRSSDTGKRIVARCDVELKKGGRCEHRAVVANEGPPVRVYCVKHMGRAEHEPGRCQALARSGHRCANPVMADDGRLCSSHRHATADYRHYATAEVIWPGATA